MRRCLRPLGPTCDSAVANLLSVLGTVLDLKFEVKTPGCCHASRDHRFAIDKSKAVQFDQAITDVGARQFVRATKCHSYARLSFAS